MAADKKISQLTGSTTLLGGAYLTGVTANGDNFKILVSDFLANVTGSTGSMESLGAGTDILSIAATVNRIRKAAAGQGISLSVDGSQALAIASSLTSDQTGAEILDISADVVKSLVAGTGIGLSQGVGTVEITATGTTAPTNRIIINQESDFPIQDATTITLSSNIIYEIGATFSTAKGFVCLDGSTMTMGSNVGHIMTYSGVGSMFTGTDATFSMYRAKIDAPNCSEVFTFTDTVGGLKALDVRSVGIVSAPKLGTVDSLFAAIFRAVGMTVDDGLSFSGTHTGFIFNEINFNTTSSSCKALDFGTAIISIINISVNLFNGPASSIFLEGAASSANIPSGLLAAVEDNSVFGGMTSLSVITKDDLRWLFFHNNSIENTKPDALAYLSGNTTATTISTISVPVLVAGSWTAESSSQMTITSGGRVTYNPDNGESLPVTISASLLMVSGGDKQVSMCLAVNGTPITAATGSGTASSTKSTRITIPWQYNFTTGDYIEVWIANTTNTENIIVTDAIIRVN